MNVSKLKEIIMEAIESAQSPLIEEISEADIAEQKEHLKTLRAKATQNHANQLIDHPDQIDRPAL